MLLLLFIGLTLGVRGGSRSSRSVALLAIPALALLDELGTAKRTLPVAATLPCSTYVVNVAGRLQIGFVGVLG